MSNPSDTTLLRERLEEACTCPICLQLFTDPITLTGCNHILDRSCLQQLIDSPAAPLCPVCRRSLGRVHPDDLPVMHAIKGMVDLLRSQLQHQQGSSTDQRTTIHANGGGVARPRVKRERQESEPVDTTVVRRGVPSQSGNGSFDRDLTAAISLSLREARNQPADRERSTNQARPYSSMARLNSVSGVTESQQASQAPESSRLEDRLLGTPSRRRRRTTSAVSHRSERSASPPVTNPSPRRRTFIPQVSAPVQSTSVSANHLHVPTPQEVAAISAMARGFACSLDHLLFGADIGILPTGDPMASVSTPTLALNNAARSRPSSSYMQAMSALRPLAIGSYLDMFSLTDQEWAEDLLASLGFNPFTAATLSATVPFSVKPSNARIHAVRRILRRTATTVMVRWNARTASLELRC
jgi:hypothetical protein